MMFAYVARLHAERVGFHGALYWLEVSGCGVNSAEDAEAFASKAAASDRTSFTSGRFRMELVRPCDDCEVTGIKRGCVKKACPTCDGAGVHHVLERIFSVTHG